MPTNDTLTHEVISVKLSKNYFPVNKNTGFRMEGYYVWCGSVLKENNTYYMFAARWPEEKTFPDGYMTDSEIVLATTDDLNKPFTFQKVIISKREVGYWDAGMAHNPFIFKANDKYVLYYIGTQNGSYEARAIGYAVADSIDGEWTRADKPIVLPPNANNPSVLQDKDGSLLLYFRDGELKVSVARARAYDQSFTILKHDLFPKGRIEDMFVFFNNGRYEMFAEDDEGSYTGNAKAGVHFISDNGIDWIPDEHPIAYNFDIEYTDGTKRTLQRRERPQVYIEGDNVYLFTTAKSDGPTILTGGKTWNMVQKMK